MSYLSTGRAEPPGRTPRHHKPPSSSVVRVQTPSVQELGDKILGAAAADWFSVDYDVPDKQILLRVSVQQHLQDVFHVHVNISISFEDEPAGDQNTVH